MRVHLMFTDGHVKGRPAVYAWLGIDGKGAVRIGVGFTRQEAAADALALVRRVTV